MFKATSNYSQSRFSNDNNKKFCGVCKKAGKPASLYEGHYTKSVPGPKGIVICPTILTSICNTCGQNGHFTNSEYCPNKRTYFKNSNDSDSPYPHVSANAKTTDSVRSKSRSVTSKTTGHGPSNIYSILSDYDDVPVVKRQKVIDNRPTPVIAPVTNTVSEEIKTLAPNGISFATILKSPAKPVSAKSLPVTIESGGFKISTKLQDTIIHDTELLARNSRDYAFSESRVKSFRTSWLSDSESDDEVDDNTAW